MKLKLNAQLHQYQEAVDAAWRQVRENRIVERIWKHDHTVWKPDPAEISNRLGWLHCPETMQGTVPKIEAFVDGVRRDGLKRVLLLGMGGSSLAPEVFRHTFGVREGYPDLSVLDSTDPGAVIECAARHEPSSTLHIVSSKSGGTVETLSLFKYFYNRALESLGAEAVGSRFAAITDPGSGLEETARSLGFREIFLNDPNIGGRFSALSYFGLMPAGLIGVDLGRLLDRAQAAKDDSSAAWLGAAMGELAAAGRDKLTLLASPSVASFGAWAEQLIAESTGKEGTGILPVDAEEIGSLDSFGDDRLFVCLNLKGAPKEEIAIESRIAALSALRQPLVRIKLNDLYDLGGEFFRWEMATAVAGWRLGINPFDQPNVESAKQMTRRMVDEYRQKDRLPDPPCSLREDGVELYGQTSANGLSESLLSFLGRIDRKSKPRSYVALQAYLRPSAECFQALQALRHRIRDRFQVAATVGFGPRFLHSTGQLHKGDAGNGLFIQFTAAMPEEAPIPDHPGSKASSLTFGLLKTAQALGDERALQEAGREVIRYHFSGDAVQGLNRLREALT